MKKVKWVNPNKMFINTGHMAFDRQTNIITTGNIYGNTQTSSYIRAFNETRNPVGEYREPGYLQKFDLAPFFDRDPKNMPLVVKVFGEYMKDQDTILYEFHHWNRNVKIIHGYILTTADHRFLDQIVTGPTYKSYKVLDVCREYITVDGEIRIEA